METWSIRHSMVLKSSFITSVQGYSTPSRCSTHSVYYLFICMGICSAKVKHYMGLPSHTICTPSLTSPVTPTPRAAGEAPILLFLRSTLLGPFL